MTYYYARNADGRIVPVIVNKLKLNLEARTMKYPPIVAIDLQSYKDLAKLTKMSRLRKVYAIAMAKYVIRQRKNAL